MFQVQRYGSYDPYLLFGMCGLIYMTSENTTKETVLHENVLFVEDGDISLSRSRWIMTVVLDINVYGNIYSQTKHRLLNRGDGLETL